MSVTLQPIYTQTATGSTNSITFNNIPQNYSHLIIEISARSTYASSTDYLTAWYNGDRSNIYSDIGLSATGTTAGFAKDYTTTAINVGAYPASTSAAGTYGNIRFVVPNYSGGAFKNSYSDAFMENSSTTVYSNYLWSQSYNSNNPITSLTLYAGSGNFASYSTFTIYGLGQSYPTSTPLSPVINSVSDLAGSASVAFTPSTNDQALNYSLTTYPATSTTYSAVSPIIAKGLNPGTPYVFQVSSNNQIASTGSAASQQLSSVNSFASIATISFPNGPSTSTPVFTNIPQNYSHLQLRIFARSTYSGGADSPAAYGFNGDNGANYTFHWVSGNGSSASSSSFTSQSNSEAERLPAGTSTANVYGCIIIDILDYANPNKYKAIRSIGGFDASGSGQIHFDGGLWQNFAPITSIYTNVYTSWAQYSHIALYGIA